MSIVCIMSNFPKQRGTGVENTLSNKIPFQIHLPGNQFCEPGMKFEEQRDIIPLDKDCRGQKTIYNQTVPLCRIYIKPSESSRTKLGKGLNLWTLLLWRKLQLDKL